MAAIFPPRDKGGVAPGANVCNGFTPTHQVNGDGPWYVSADCTTVLTDCQLNALTSELLAAVDRLGYPFNTNIITNVGDALVEQFSFKVSRAGDSMLGPFFLSRDPVEPMEATTKQYVDALGTQVNGKVNRSGDTMGGMLSLFADPTQPMHAVTRQYLLANFVEEAPMDGVTYGRANGEWIEAGGGSGGASFLPLTGGTLTGPLTLSGTPTADLHASTKLYVDQTALSVATTAAGGRVARAGDTMTGPLVLSGAPTLDLHAATKLYVDTADAGKVAKAGDTMTGNLTIARTGAAIILNASGTPLPLQAGLVFSRGGLVRWQFEAVNSTTEIGSNNGSDFRLWRYNDAGTGLDVPFWVRRVDGNTRCNRLGAGVDSIIDLNLSNIANISTTTGLDTNHGMIIRSRSAAMTSAIAFQYSSGAVVGNIAIGSDQVVYNTTSDARLKENVQPFTDGRAIVDALDVQAFTWAASGADDVGVMAQDAEQIYPPAVTPGRGAPGDADFQPWGVDYSKYVPILLQTLQDAFRKIDDLTARVAALEAAAAKGGVT